MGWLLLAVCLVCKALNILCGLIGWRLYVYKQDKGELPQQRVELTLTVGPTGNCETGSGNDQTSNANDAIAQVDDQPAVEEESQE